MPILRLLPTVEAVATCALATSQGIANDPDDQEDHRGDPEDVQCKTEPEEEYDDQQSKK
jgi:hypothetical protein